jgi:hypothetical protein
MTNNTMKVLGMVPGLLAGMALVMVRDPILATRLSRVLRMSAPCLGNCSCCNGACCLDRSLHEIQGCPVTPVQHRLLCAVAEPVFRALGER